MKNRTGELKRIVDKVLVDKGVGDMYEQLTTQPDGICADAALYIAGVRNQILKACKDKGLAFVGDRELPEDIWASPMNAVEHDAQQAMLRAGYKPVEEIKIEENTTKKNTD